MENGLMVDEKDFIVNGKELMVNEKQLMVDGKVLIVNGKQLLVNLIGYELYTDLITYDLEMSEKKGMKNI